MLVYKIQNLVNGKVYIGKTSLSTKRRLQIHFQKARGGSQTYFHRAVRKYGETNFFITPFATTQTDIDLLERVCIAQECPEYNMTVGGEGGNTSGSPNYKLGMKNRRKYYGASNPNFGKLGANSPNFGKRRGCTPAISEAKRKRVMASGMCFASIGDAERTLHIKWSYSSHRYPDRYYLVNPRAARDTEVSA